MTSDSTRVSEDLLLDRYGVSVFTRRWDVAEPHALVLISHGASEHSGRYDRFARRLNESGFAVAALDHRGHGRTAASSGAGVMGAGAGEAVIDDLHELRAAAESAVGAGVPTYVFGHSMGALIAFAYLTRHSVGLAGAVLCGFPADVVNTAAVASLLQEAIAGGLRDAPFDALSQNNEPFEPARTPFDWLSRDPDEVDRYIADPMCGDSNPLTYGYFADLFAVVAPAREAMTDIRCAVLVIAGDQDPAAGMGVHAATLAQTLSDAGVPTDLQLYPDARHELLNETNRDEVVDDIIDWLNRRG